MTRINLIPVQELMDQHLFAEYRELPRVASALRKSLNIYGKDIKKIIPEKFCLGTGHVKFFYDKGLFLLLRYRDLCKECTNRNININPVPDNHFIIFKTIDFLNDWSPAKEDIALSRKRIEEKISMKPSWYRKTKYEK